MPLIVNDQSKRNKRQIHNLEPCLLQPRWQEIHGEELFEMDATVWDRFHVVDAALAKAVQGHEPSNELLDILAELDRMINIGEGRVLRDGIAREANLRYAMLPRIGGTRKMAFLQVRFIQNFKLISLFLHARLEWRGSSALEQLTCLSRRVSDPCFLAFVVPFELCVEQCIRPYVLKVQKVDQPSAVARSAGAMVRELQDWSESRRASHRFLTFALATSWGPGLPAINANFLAPRLRAR